MAAFPTKLINKNSLGFPYFSGDPLTAISNCPSVLPIAAAAHSTARKKHFMAILLIKLENECIFHHPLSESLLKSLWISLHFVKGRKKWLKFHLSCNVSIHL